MIEVILVAPRIPQNTGNIARTCVVTGASLVLVRPLGFSLAERHLKRSGLDYWKDLHIEVIDDLFARLEKEQRPFYFFSSKASQLYSEVAYQQEAILIFGSEDAGLPPEYRQRWPERFVTFPMIPGQRSLNLSNAVAIGVYEAWRQQQFPKVAH